MFAGKKRDLIVMVLIVVTVSVFAGGGREQAPGDSGDLRGQTITVLSVQDPFYWGLEAMVERFEQETGINVNLEPMGYDALMARLTTSFVTQAADMDVVVVDDPRLAQFADNNWILPLDSFIDRDREEVDLGDFWPAALHTSSIWRGQVWTLPIAPYTQMVMYRKDLLDAAGLRHPPETFEDWWTWDTYLEYVKALDELGDDVYGTVIVGAQPEPITHMYTGIEVSRGVRWFENFPQTPWDFTPTLNTQKSIDTLEFYKELYEYSPEEAINYVWFDAGVAFSTMDIGMFFWWSPYATLINQPGYMEPGRSPNYGKYGFAVMPHQPGEERKYSQGGWTLGIARYSERQNAAWEFVKRMTSADYLKEMALHPAQMTAFNDLPRVSLLEDPDLRRAYPSIDVQLRMAEYTDGKTARPHFPLYPSLEGVYGREINRALAGQISSAQAMENIEDGFRIILRQNYYLPFSLAESDESWDRSLDVIRRLSR
jgi:multiple sugar transport system substrate-binding protein